MNILERYGPTESLINESKENPNLKIGRIVSQSKDLYKVITEEQELLAEVSGKFRFEHLHSIDFPSIGDFVMLDRASDKDGNGNIHKVLNRKSSFVRKAAGLENEVQVIASNIDVLFICMSLNADYNLRRLERYLAIAWESGATPIIILTKADLCKNVQSKIYEVEEIAIGVDVISTSSYIKESYEKIASLMQKGQTYAFIGSTGVGKSTIINLIIGKEVLETGEIRKNDKGRHTTSRRDLILLSNGSLVIDTPGMREIGLVDINLEKSFSDIFELEQKCKFRDCTHSNEPGCAIREAIEMGEIDEPRFENYLKLKKESKYNTMNTRQIEKEKINTMFASFGGIKNARNFAKNKKK